MKAPLPHNELERLQRLLECDILDTAPEPAYDDFARLAAQICRTPIGLVTLMDKDRQWFKARIGISAPELPRDTAFCAHALLCPEVLVISDAMRDRRVRDNPFVIGDPGIRFYAGAPLLTRDGYALGTLCVLDTVPRRLSLAQRDALAALARQATMLLEMRCHSFWQQSEAGVQAITDNVPVLIARMDTQRRYCFANRAYHDFFGIPLDQVIGHTLWDVLGDDAYAVIRPYVDRVLAGESVSFDARVPFRTIGPRDLHISYAPDFRVDGRVAGFVLSAMDVSAWRQAEEALRQSEERLQNALKAGGMGAWEMDSSSRTGTVSNGLEALYGLPPDALEGRFENFLKYVHPDDLPHILALQQKSDLADYELEYRVIWPDGSIHWLRSKGQRFYDAQGVPSRVSGAIVDITERKALEAERERLLAEAIARADHCPLTGLLNHRAFHKCLEEETDQAVRSGTFLSVAMLDLNDFKFFNDSYGHRAGDDVLRQVAAALRDHCRAGDILARFGGDEFALIMPGIGSAQAAQIVSRLCADVERLGYRPPGHHSEIPLVMSAGIAVFPQDAISRLEVVALADERLHRAKTGGQSGDEAESLRASLSHSIDGFSMLDALVTAVDNKDRYTRKHSEDVMEYSVQIARELGLGKRAEHDIAIAALLHDVGKIGVPDHILRKPGRLTNEETEVMRHHPLMGAAIVQAVPGLEATLDAVRHHHERWDGEGYPFGLTSEEAPLFARLMAVADAFSAMTTDRPYRKGMVEERALQILNEGSGTQWDPVCVAAFLRLRSRLHSSVSHLRAA